MEARPSRGTAGHGPENDVTQPTPDMAPSRSELDEQLLDYLYGELEPEQRAAFERALPAHPELVKELEQHRWTRARMAELPVVPLPAGALDQAMLAAEQHIQAATPATVRPGFFARLGKLFLQPAFATAFVAVLGVGVGLFMSRSRELPALGPSPDDQVGAQVGAAASQASEPAVPAVKVRDHAAAARPRAEIVRNEARADEPSVAVAEPTVPPAAAGPAAAPPSTAEVGGGGRVTGPTSDPRKDRAAEQPRSAAGGALADKAAVAKEKAPDPRPTDGLAAGVWEGSPKADPRAAGFGDGEADQPADTSVLYRATITGDDQADGRAKTGSGAATTNTEDRAHPTMPAPAARTESADREVVTLAERESKKVTIDDDAKPKGSEPRLTTDKPGAKPAEEERRSNATTTSPPPTPAAEPKAPARDETKPDTRTSNTVPQGAPPSEERLWANYQAQLAAGAFADANKTLADLLKLTGDTTKLKAARADLSKREADAKKAEAGKAPAEKLPPDPSGPTPGKTP